MVYITKLYLLDVLPLETVIVNLRTVRTPDRIVMQTQARKQLFCFISENNSVLFLKLFGKLKIDFSGK